MKNQRVFLLICSSSLVIFFAFQNCSDVNINRQLASVSASKSQCVDSSGSSPIAILDSISVTSRTSLSAYVIESKFSDNTLISSSRKFEWTFDDVVQPSGSILTYGVSSFTACSNHKITAKWNDPCLGAKNLEKNYMHPGSNCQEIIQPACKGPIPLNAEMCPLDDLGLTVDAIRALVNSCSFPIGSVPKCEYVCSAGYQNIAGVCTPIPKTFVCEGTVPAHSSLCPGDDLNLTANTVRSLVSTCSAPAGTGPKCEYSCDVNYEFRGGVCTLIVPPSPVLACVADLGTLTDMQSLSADGTIGAIELIRPVGDNRKGQFSFRNMIAPVGIKKYRLILDVRAGESTASHAALANLTGVVEDIALGRVKFTVSLSQGCTDFGVTSQILKDKTYDLGASLIRTTDDSRAGFNVGVITKPGIWYLNIQTECEESSNPDVHGCQWTATYKGAWP